jgi:hypothetical protein
MRGLRFKGPIRKQNSPTRTAGGHKKCIAQRNEIHEFELSQ